jgi:hypothetical protein
MHKHGGNICFMNGRMCRLYDGWPHDAGYMKDGRMVPVT